MLNKAALPLDKEIQLENEDIITFRLTEKVVRILKYIQQIRYRQSHLKKKVILCYCRRVVIRYHSNLICQ